MSGPQFFETRMGHKFYEGTMPALVRELKALNGQLIALNGHLAAVPALATAIKSFGEAQIGEGE